MEDFVPRARDYPRCIVTHGAMGHLDPDQPPTKRKPFASILNLDFISKAELILPEEIFEVFQDGILTAHSRPTYSKVIIPLLALIEGDFFTEYIKKGNILMLSEGSVEAGNVYHLKKGILTLHLDKESYERAGIEGNPDGVKGKRGTKPRWVVEINLRQPSMVHGKKGFDRIFHAFKTVLVAPVTWLFKDLDTESLGIDPLEKHFPIRQTACPEILRNVEVRNPPLRPNCDKDSLYTTGFEDFATETYEWLSFIMLDSPRTNPGDKIDPVLSRYQVPGDADVRSRLTKITWKGLLGPLWAHKLFVSALLAVSRNDWFAYSVSGFPGKESKDCTILKVPNTAAEYILWDIE